MSEQRVIERLEDVALAGGPPVVLCAVDWIGIANEGHDAFRDALAEAAGTTRERVAVHALHQIGVTHGDLSPANIVLVDGHPVLVDLATACIDGWCDPMIRGTLPYEFRTTLVRAFHTEEDIENIGRAIRGAKNYFLQNFEDSGDLVGFGNPSSCVPLSGFSVPEIEHFRDILGQYAENVGIRN